MSEMRDGRPTSNDFGPLIHEHKMRTSRQSFYLGLAAATLGASVLSLAYGIWRWYFAFANFGPAVVWRWSWSALLAGIALAVTGLGALVAGRRQRWPEVRTYRRGLSVRSGRRQAQIPWKDIARVYTASIRYGLRRLGWKGHAQLTVILQDGRRLTLTNLLSDFDLLVETIKRNIYPRLLVRYTRAFNQGKPVRFGPLTLDAQGVHKGRKILLWHEIGQSVLRDGRLTLEPTATSRARRMQVPAHEVPNVDLCVQLLQRIGQRT